MNMEKIEVTATLANLDVMIDFAVCCAAKQCFDKEALSEIRLASEEALVNVAKYAYPDKEGTVTIACAPAKEGGIVIEISDAGVPFDPLTLKEPDISLPIERRTIGGLGIFMIRRIMTRVEYRRENGRNILTLTKIK